MLESLTVNVSEAAFVALVGVPEIVPVLALNARPDGRDPLVRAQVYGADPPLAASAVLYAVPTLPFGRLVVDITSGD